MRATFVTLAALALVIGACGGGGDDGITPPIDARVDAPAGPPSVSIAAMQSVVEGNAPTSIAMVEVTLSAAATGPVTVDYATTDGTATSPADYAPATGTLTFAAGTTSQAIAITIAGDHLDEDDEVFTITLTNASGASLDAASGTITITITDDDATPALAVAPASATEGAGDLVFAVNLSAASGRTVTVAYATVNGSADAGDYTAGGDTLTFLPGELTKMVTVAVTDDALDEDAETVRLVLSAAVNATTGAPGIGTISDNDDPPVMSVGPAMAGEGAVGGLVFTVSLSAASGRPVMATYVTSNGSAGAPADYTAANAMVLFMPGATTATVAVALVNDTIDEADETLTLTLSAPMNATLPMALPMTSATGTILDDDGPPTVSITATTTVVEGNSNTVPVMLTVTLSAASGLPVSVAYAAANGSAVAPADYTLMPGPLLFPPGTTTKMIALSVVGDRLDEDDETFTVNLSAPVNVDLGTATSTVTITDDDALPTVSVANVSVVEGAPAGLGFVVTLSAASGRVVTVSYASANNTTSLADYTPVDTTVPFMPGETSKTITVAVVNDTLDEPDETMFFMLPAAVNATISTAMATGTIVDDDPPPSLSVAAVTGNEGDGSLGFVVSLSTASGRPITVSYATSNGTATTPADYTAPPPGMMLPFAPGEVSKTVNVPVVDDALDELDETFTLTLSGAVNATIATAQAIGTITDNDAPPTVSIAPAATLLEGNAGTTAGSVNVTLSAPAGQPVTVIYEAVDGTATTVADYAEPSGALTFAPGTTTLSIPIEVTGDTLDEPDETFEIRLIAVHAGTLGVAASTMTIADDDAAPSLAVAAVSAAEGSPRGLAFVVTLSAPSARTIQVDYTTADGTAGPADYTGPPGTIELAPGETPRAIPIAIHNDSLREPDETMTLTLSAPVNASLLAADATGTIIDDDPQPIIAIADGVVAEPDAGATVLSFPVTLSAPSGQDVTVQYGTTAGTASGGVDYGNTAGLLIILAGATSATIDVAVNGDDVVEADEAFSVTLSGPVNGFILGSATAAGTILDDDASLPALSIDDAAIAEGNAGTSNLTFSVRLAAPSAGVVTVSYATVNGTATDAPGVGGTDYVPQIGTLTFAPGVVLRTITVAVVGDVNHEADEAFQVRLAGAAGAIIADAVAAGTITDDDALPSLSASPVPVPEGQATAVFTVNLSVPSGDTVTVDYATVDGSATAGGHAGAGGEDYIARSGTLTFLPGETSKTVAVSINADALDEADETFGFTLASAAHALIATARVDATIADDDAAPSVAVADVADVEGRGLVGSVAIPVTLSAPSGRTVTVQYATGGAPAAPTATPDDDYVSIPPALS